MGISLSSLLDGDIEYNEPEQFHAEGHEIEEIEGLTEQFVDEGYEMKELTKKDVIFYDRVYGLFGPNKLVSFREIKALMKTWYPHPRITINLRRIWRAGKSRRFVAHEMNSGWGRKGNGQWYGVHYVFLKRKDDKY